MPAPCSFAAAAMLGGEAYVVEGAAHAPSVLAFDRQQRRWRHCAGLATPRVNMAVAAMEEQLYVLVRVEAGGAGAVAAGGGCIGAGACLLVLALAWLPRCVCCIPVGWCLLAGAWLAPWHGASGARGFLRVRAMRRPSCACQGCS